MSAVEEAIAAYKRRKQNERSKAYYAAHRDELAAKARAYRAEHTAEKRAIEQAYRDSHREQERTRVREYYRKKTYGGEIMTLTMLIQIMLLLEQDATEHQRLVEWRRDRIRELEELIDRGESGAHEAELREQLADAQDAYDTAYKERSAANAALRELVETDFRG